MFQKRLPSGLVNEIVNIYGVPTWISCIKPKETQSKIFVLVIPGNPGPIGFYESFIESLYLTSDCSLTVYGISHAGLQYILMLYSCTRPYFLVYQICVITTTVCLTKNVDNFSSIV